MVGKNRLARRSFLIGGGAAATIFGLPVPFLRNLAPGLVPIALAQDTLLATKQELTLLGERPINMEVPVHLLDDDITRSARLFVRNNGQVPDVSQASDENWMLSIDGEVDQPLALSIADLKNNFENVTLQLQIECAGNGRRFYSPGAPGNQWTLGGIGCAAWTGVRLSDVLARAGVRNSATYTAHYGADPYLTGDPNRDAISRGVPIAKAMEEHNLIAWAVNGEDIPVLNGYPLRLVVPGWPGSCSQKWLTRIWVRDQVHDGEKMTGTSYRLPAYPVAPGTEVPTEDLAIIQSLPVKSLITAPETGVRVARGETFNVRGHAWAGDRDVAAMHVSIDFGKTWSEAEIAAPPNRYAWQRWSANVRLPNVGYFEVWARATDSQNVSQPPVTPGWNPSGYNNNMQHRIAVFAV